MMMMMIVDSTLSKVPKKKSNSREDNIGTENADFV